MPLPYFPRLVMGHSMFICDNLKRQFTVIFLNFVSGTCNLNLSHSKFFILERYYLLFLYTLAPLTRTKPNFYASQVAETMNHQRSNCTLLNQSLVIKAGSITVNCSNRALLGAWRTMLAAALDYVEVGLCLRSGKEDR
jgi:hypothetical protein